MVDCAGVVRIHLLVSSERRRSMRWQRTWPHLCEMGPQCRSSYDGGINCIYGSGRAILELCGATRFYRKEAAAVTDERAKQAENEELRQERPLEWCHRCG